MKTLVAISCVVAILATQTVVAADAKEQGRLVFKEWCEPCHGRAAHLPATAGLTIKYKGKIPGALEDRKDLTPTAVKTFVRQGAFSMAPFRKTEISDAELGALASYLAGKK
jgi:(+)-pinoresinol hydroxylase